ncbi:hypothetical protein D3C80_2194110 [compost metagenome]
MKYLNHQAFDGIALFHGPGLEDQHGIRCASEHGDQQQLIVLVVVHQRRYFLCPRRYQQ